MMQIVISPAKSLDFQTPMPELPHSRLQFMQEASILVDVMRNYSAEQLSKLMSISPALAELNVARFTAWSLHPEKSNLRQAVFAFNGDVYEGLQVRSLQSDHLSYLQNHLRILSGLYGVVRPFDLIQAYRLEMGSRLLNPKGKNLYAYWGSTVTDSLNKTFQSPDSDYLINLASEEYFKVIQAANIKAKVISPVFLENKNGTYKIISFYAKKARGLMARYCALHQIDNAEQLKEFNLENYSYSAADSDQKSWVFKRNIPS